MPPPPHSLVFRNRWDTLTVPEIGKWRPELRVTVVVPAYDCQRTLDLTLASLSTQTYPGDLLEVVVVDDGSDPPVELPKICPRDCRLVRAAEHSPGWGRANASHIGAAHSTGDILHWLDADMVAFPHHVEAQARWHHAVPYAAVLGYKRFVREGWVSPEDVAERGRQGTTDQLFARERTEPHDYVEERIRRSHGLRGGDHLDFLAHVGATASVRRDMYVAAGGFQTGLRLGEDTELGYRLMQAGALFVPEPQSGSWHIGASHMMTVGAPLRRYNWPHLADHMPHPRWLRDVGGRSWAVPLVTAVVRAGDAPLEAVRTCVDHLLASDEHDLRVLLVGSWSSLADERRQVLDDPRLDLRLIAATYASDPRVRLVEAAPETVFPSPYRLDVPVHLAVGAGTVRRLVTDADRWRVGLVRVLTGRDGSRDPLSLWRTAAVSRARFGDHDRLAAAVAEVYGERWVSGHDVDVTDLSGVPVTELRSPRPWRAEAAAGAARDDRPAPAPPRPGGSESVTVGGVRSLLRAVLFVARLGAGRARRLLAGKLAAAVPAVRRRPDPTD